DYALLHVPEPAGGRAAERPHRVPPPGPHHRGRPAGGRPTRVCPGHPRGDVPGRGPPRGKRMTPLSAQRIFALLLRQLYLYRRSMIRMLEVVYWPVMDLLVWGFVSVYVGRLRGGGAEAVAFTLGGMLICDIFFRRQQSLAV